MSNSSNVYRDGRLPRLEADLEAAQRRVRDLEEEVRACTVSRETNRAHMTSSASQTRPKAGSFNDFMSAFTATIVIAIVMVTAFIFARQALSTCLSV